MGKASEHQQQQQRQPRRETNGSIRQEFARKNEIEFKVRKEIIIPPSLAFHLKLVLYEIADTALPKDSSSAKKNGLHNGT